MKKRFIATGIAAALASSPIQSAEPGRSTKLTCDGSFIIFQGQSDEIAAKGIYLEITETHVKVLGVPVFANAANGSLYQITNRNEQIVGFKNQDNSNLNGSVNRSNGELNLMEKLASSTRYINWFKATCLPYRPMF